jgi:hypothetical protein
MVMTRRGTGRKRGRLGNDCVHDVHVHVQGWRVHGGPRRETGRKSRRLGTGWVCECVSEYVRECVDVVVGVYGGSGEGGE